MKLLVIVIRILDWLIIYLQQNHVIHSLTSLTRVVLIKHLQSTWSSSAPSMLASMRRIPARQIGKPIWKTGNGRYSGKFKTPVGRGNHFVTTDDETLYFTRPWKLHSHILNSRYSRTKIRALRRYFNEFYYRVFSSQIRNYFDDPLAGKIL